MAEERKISLSTPGHELTGTRRMDVLIQTDRSGIDAKCVLFCPVTTHLSFWHKCLKYIVPGGSEMPLGTQRLTPLKTFRFVTLVIIVLDSIIVYQVSVWETFTWDSACEIRWGGVCVSDSSGRLGENWITCSQLVISLCGWENQC